MNSTVTFKERYDELIDAIEAGLLESIEDTSGEKAESICKAAAEKIHRKPRYVSEIFSFITGLPLGSYLKLRKLEIAFSAKISGRKDTWDEAALMVYKDVSSFKNAFKHAYGMSVTEAEKQPDFLTLMYPLYLDLVLEGRYVNMENKVLIDNSDWTQIKDFELYNSLYDVGFSQLTFAKEYVDKHPTADLDYILEILSEQYADHKELVFSDFDKASFELIGKNGFSRKQAEYLTETLINEGYSCFDGIDTNYLRIMEQIFFNLESGTFDDVNQKVVMYSDYLKIKSELASKGYQNFWDLFRLITCTSEEETWEESIKYYLDENPYPITGEWSEEEICTGEFISDTVSLAEILVFAEKVYGRDRFISMKGPYEELVFAAMLKKQTTETEAESFIAGEMNEELSKFLDEDFGLRLKYDRMTGKGETTWM